MPCLNLLQSLLSLLHQRFAVVEDTVHIFYIEIFALRDALKDYFLFAYFFFRRVC